MSDVKAYTQSYPGVDGITLLASDAKDQFTLIQTALTLGDGKASITYGTNWADVSSQTRLRKILGGNMVVLNMNVACSGAPGSPIITLPAGYRPAAVVDGVPAVWYDSSAGYYYPALATILTSGAISMVVMNGAGTITPATGDAANLHVIFGTN